MEEEGEVEDHLAADGLRGRVTITGHLSDRQVKTFLRMLVQFGVAQLEIDLSRKGILTVLTM